MEQVVLQLPQLMHHHQVRVTHPERYGPQVIPAYEHGLGLVYSMLFHNVRAISYRTDHI